MTLDPGKAGIFIDGENILLTLYKLGWKIDYQKLLEYIKISTNSEIIKKTFYSRNDNSPSEKKKRFFSMLNDNKFKVHYVDSKPKVNGDGYICNADPIIITDMIFSVHSEDINTIILLSGDGDFSYPLEQMQDLRVRVFVISTFSVANKEYIVNNEKFTFIDINDIRDEIELKFY